MKKPTIAYAKALGLLAALVLVFIPLTNPPSYALLQDIVSWSRGVNEPISLEEQRSTAIHEAGHVVASRALRGLGSLEAVRVYTALAPRQKRTLLGMSDVNVAIRPRSRPDAMRVAAMFFAGGIAENDIAKHDPQGSMDDVRHANQALAGYRAESSGDGYAETSEVTKTPSGAFSLFADVSIATTCAEAITAQNRQVITALAETLLQQTERFDRKRMDTSELNDFFATHKVVLPLPECMFEQD